ncbi:Fic family protein [Asaia lannensis]|uniref:Fic family protein n=1 Tax=Asaia lannensis NBRC 102526 TaxID=1307926 RepID=A0ABT1CK11_9PROT|nr:Fic family protein [Asaia lannensis]MCO6161175.1 Fic family protein [Asaia lannensis NBRC 102526]GBR01327.1 hypothetical protein AA102526_2477 [Asaia lannensis NBRC 102526]
MERVGIAHLWLETIHPFEDGNGRLGRALAEKALARSLEISVVMGLAATINTHKEAYYDELHRVSTSNYIESWMAWFASIVLEAQSRTIATISFVVEKARFLDGLRGQLNPRQERAVLRMLAEGIDGFRGGLRAQNYRAITGEPPPQPRVIWRN